MRLTLGFSPCPNDTFIFDALVNRKIDTGGLVFEVILEDVETLNRLAIANTLDITKMSYGAWPLVVKDYLLLNSGSALGTGVGPLLIAKKTLDTPDISQGTVAIPGENTTAHMLFSLAFPKVSNKIFLRYDQIEDYVLEAPQDNTAGVIIHENRFTYEDKGLQKIVDLGKFWEDKTGLPIPLGGIVAKRAYDKNLLNRIDELIKKSIQYAFGNYPGLPEYVRENAMEMQESVMRKHIDLYVNEYSLGLGSTGKEAVKKLLNIYTLHNYGYPEYDNSLFLETQE